MDKFATENLILLEFLVDQINLDFEIQQELASVMGETCVSFQFLDNAPLLVCEQDFSNNRLDQNTNVKSGKSCLFSLTPEQANEVSKTFDITVEVFKKMKPGVLPDKIPIGACLISITNLFNELVESITNAGESPAAKALKDCFKVASVTGDIVGHISVYIRMSCFGKLIVTQFQMNLEDKSVQFKAKEGHYLFKYNKGKGDGGRDDSCPCRQPQPQRNLNCPQVPCSNFMMNEQAPPVFKNTACPIQPCMFNPAPEEQDDLGPCGLPQMQMPCAPQMNYMPQMPCEMPQAGGYGMQQFPPCNVPPITDNPSAAYQEIGASMGGNALTIRVHKDKKAEEYDDTDTSEDCCHCTMENFGKKRKAQQQNACGPCPMPNQKQQLAMRPGVPDPNSPFSFTMAGCGNAAKNNVIVNPPTSTTKDGTCFTEISDPNRDVFILRIGKKSEGADKKSNLELELCTPKGPELKPPPKKETRDTQYDEADMPDGGKGGKGGKGKKGKGKGKGKKGKGKGGKGGKKGKGGKGSGASGADGDDEGNGGNGGGKGGKTGAGGGGGKTGAGSGGGGGTNGAGGNGGNGNGGGGGGNGGGGNGGGSGGGAGKRGSVSSGMGGAGGKGGGGGGGKSGGGGGSGSGKGGGKGGGGKNGGGTGGFGGGGSGMGGPRPATASAVMRESSSRKLCVSQCGRPMSAVSCYNRCSSICSSYHSSTSPRCQSANTQQRCQATNSPCCVRSRCRCIC